jgi:hypothetical protein
MMPPADSQEPLDAHVSSACLADNVAFHGDQAEVLKIVAAGPRGAAALAALSVFVVLLLWFAFYLFVFLPRGAIG